MYLIEPRTSDIVIKQLLYKLKANSGMFYGLIAIQLFGLIASAEGVNSSGTNRGGLIINVHKYSADIVIFFTIIWLFFCAIRLAVEYREMDSSFVSNRFCSNISNIGFLVLVSGISGITASLCAVVMRVIIYFYAGSENIADSNFFMAPQYLILGIASSILFIVLFCSLGYFYGILIKLSRLFIFFVPACILGEIIITNIFNQNNNEYNLIKIVKFYFTENSFLVFLIKVVITSVVVFTSAVILSGRVEVRK